jgi:hypothetical protein
MYKNAIIYGKILLPPAKNIKFLLRIIEIFHFQGSLKSEQILRLSLIFIHFQGYSNSRKNFKPHFPLQYCYSRAFSQSSQWQKSKMRLFLV